MPFSKVEKTENITTDDQTKNFLTEAEILKFLKASDQDVHFLGNFQVAVIQSDVAKHFQFARSVKG